MIPIALAVVVVGLAGIGAAWHVAMRLISDRLVIAGEAKLREEMASIQQTTGERIGELREEIEAVGSAASDAHKQAAIAEQLAKKAEERARNLDVGVKLGGRS